jgi:hypothetical protein
VSDIFDRVFGSPQVRTTAKARRKDGSVVRVSKTVYGAAAASVMRSVLAGVPAK